MLDVVGTMPGVVTLWSAPAAGGAVRRIVQGAPLPDGTHRLYTYESTGEDQSHDLIRAFEADGREAWSAAAGGSVVQLSGDPSGGVVALVNDCETYTTRLLVFGPHGGGAVGAVGVGPFAIHPNGPLYYVDQSHNLVGLDIGLGGGPGATDTRQQREAAMGRGLGRRVWLSYLSTGAALAILRVTLLVWLTHRFVSQTVTETVYVLMRGLYPEGLLIAYGPVGAVHLDQTEYLLIFGSLLTLGSFVMATPILLVGWLARRRRTT